ncbi:hypothetical protein NMG60_11028698 [Bertholletia excelsa]
MGRAPCCDKANVKRGPWSPEEDAVLKAYIESNGTGGNWIALPQKIGLNRCGKSCRLRWLNYLRPNIRHGGFSEEEDNIICSLYLTIGSRWSVIAAQLPGRTDNDIKNYWNTRLKKKLMGRQRKESTKAWQVMRSLGEDVKRENIETLMVNSAAMNPTPNWPETPNLPMVEDQFKCQESLRKLLASLGGKFHTDDCSQPNITTNLQCPFDNSMLDPTSTSHLPSTTFCDEPGSGFFQGFNNYSAEIADEMQQLDGSGCFSVFNLVNGSSGTSSAESTATSWVTDNYSVVYPPFMISSLGQRESQAGSFSFEELSYFGLQ